MRVLVSPRLYTVRFEEGLLGIQIKEIDGRVAISSCSGQAVFLGVGVGDLIVQIGSHDVESSLSDVPDNSKCMEIKTIISSYPRPINIVFEDMSNEDFDQIGFQPRV